MFTSVFDSNGIRPSAVCRVQRQKLAFFHDPEKIDRIRSDMSGDRRWGLGLGTPRNEVLSNSHGAPIAPEIPMRGARCSRFTGAVAAPINSLSKRTGDRLPREECLRRVLYKSSTERPYYRLAGNSLPVASVVWQNGFDFHFGCKDGASGISLWPRVCANRPSAGGAAVDV